MNTAHQLERYRRERPSLLRELRRVAEVFLAALALTALGLLLALLA